MAKASDKGVTRKNRVVRTFKEGEERIDAEKIERQNRLMICALIAFSSLWAMANMSFIHRNTGRISLLDLIQNPLISIFTFFFCLLVIGIFVGYVRWVRELHGYTVIKWVGLTVLLLITPLCASLPTALVPNYGLPYIAVTILLAKLFRPSFIFFSMVLMMICVAVFRGFSFPEFIPPMAAILAVALTRPRGAKRFEEIGIGFLAGGALIFGHLVMGLQRAVNEGSTLFSFIIGLVEYIPDYGYFLLQGVLSAFGAILLTPVMERVFDFVSDATLLELSDHNHELLRSLLLRAPGTYNHSLIVGTLAEGAANEIGANGLACRVGAYYHDIGKMIKPEYFTENELGRANKHTDLSPSISALIITSHPKDGLELANEYRLPTVIKNAIMMHHGTSKIEYFYRKALQIKDENEEVDESMFRYPGPKPNTREAGIMMLSDVCEAATRSLTEPTPARIRSLVHSVIQHKIDDHQLDECPLTMLELHQIEETFIRMTISIFHSRIKYPGQEE